MRGGDLAYVLNMAVEPRHFGALVDKTSMSALARGTIIDGNGFIVSRWDERTDTIGQRAGAPYQAARARSGSFVTRGPSREGEATVFAAHTSAMTGWTAVSAQLEAQPQLSAQNAWRIGAAAALGSLLLGIWLAARFAARITEAIHVLREVAVGRAAPGTINPVAEFVPVHDALARARMLDTVAAQERERLIIAQTREQELEEMARTKDQFIRTLSHELRNPLGAIRNATALLRRGAPMETPVAILERQTDQLMRLVSDLMDASRLALDKVSLDKARHDLRDLLVESVESVQHQFVQRHQACHLQSPARAIEVEVDASRIRQVLTNLLDNASKYSPEGSTVRVTMACHGLMARIEIHDEGVGLDAADLERVFEPFVQAGSRGEATAGLGLGLSIAQHLIRQHGGTITLASPGRGRGAVVTVELPLAGTEAAPVEIPGNLTA
jgi:signal transduction histidine kinase